MTSSNTPIDELRLIESRTDLASVPLSKFKPFLHACNILKQRGYDDLNATASIAVRAIDDFFFFNRDIRHTLVSEYLSGGRYRNSVNAVRLWHEQPSEDRDTYVEALIGELKKCRINIDLSYRLQ
ncbi:hypothetical protein L3V16_20850 [Brucella ciceri]|uniref:hypothetical protein n=1 Tax=Brucella ciceri TaxID=391287 RepID=UPI001F1367B4|nr:hypothetical protein [Brucella ciceri]MCH6206275.1 hypothetical protein [Brucella ciceri]